MITSSFFDDDEPNSQIKGFWKTEHRHIRIKESKFTTNPNKYFRGTLYKKGKKPGEYKPLLFILVENRLSYMKLESEAGYILLENHTLDIFDNKESNSYAYGFRLLKNRHYTEFYSETQENRDEWILKLQKHCILNNFFNDFNAISVLGKGNFAKVYKVKSRTTEKEYAAKIFEKKELTKTAKLRKTILSEIRIMRLLDHPYIMKMHQVYEGEQHIYLVFDLLNGKELFERVIARKNYTEKNAANVIKKLMETMRYLQKREILHRDIKLENILLESVEDDCSVRLADFGLSMLMSEYDPNVRCGTPGYVAPEILKSLHYDYKSDIFSLGIVLFIMLSGSAPFPGKTFDEIISKNKKCEPKFNPKYWEKVSGDAIDLVKEMMNAIPEERLSWEQVLENEWLVKMTQDDTPDPLLENTTLDESSEYIEEENLSDSSENVREDDMYEQEFIMPKKEASPYGNGNGNEFGFHRAGTLTAEAINNKMRVESKFNEKNFEKKQSMHILAATDKSPSPVRKRSNQNAANGALFSKFKDSVSLDQSMPSQNIPFKMNVFSNSRLNSFYRKATMMNSFNRGNSLFTAFQGQEDSARRIGGGGLDSPAVLLRKKTLSHNAEAYGRARDSHSLTNAKDSESYEPEEIATAIISEFFRENLTVSDKVASLNRKTYSFTPSKSFQRLK